MVEGDKTIIVSDVGSPGLSWGVLYRELAQRNSLLRTFQNAACSGTTLDGRGIDIGAGSSDSSYHRFLDRVLDVELEAYDLVPTEKVGYLNVEGPFPFDSEVFDFVLCFNLLEHIWDYRNCVDESHRVLRPGGRLIGDVPFLLGFHGETDFFRFTGDSLERLF